MGFVLGYCFFIRLGLLGTHIGSSGFAFGWHLEKNFFLWKVEKNKITSKKNTVYLYYFFFGLGQIYFKKTSNEIIICNFFLFYFILNVTMEERPRRTVTTMW